MTSLQPVSGRPVEVVAALRAWLDAQAEPTPLEVETSGSTGDPKRVVLSRRAVLASVRATERRLGARGQWLLALPVTYVAGLQVVIRSLVAGREPILLEDHSSLAAAVADADGPVFTSLVPTQLHRLLEDPRDADALAMFTAVLVGGSLLEADLRDRAQRAGVRLVSTYGMSETCGGCVYDGLPLDGVRVACDDDGRIRISGPVLFTRYADDPELTAESLVDGWFVTSDAGVLDDNGRLAVLGRVDDVVISGGLNIPLPAVTRTVREHPRVVAAELLGVRDEEWGQRVVAFVVGDVSLDEVRDWVAEVHPRAWAPRQLVPVEDFPLLENGKLDRLALAATARSAGTST